MGGSGLARHSFVGGINDVVDRCCATNYEIGYTNSCRPVAVVGSGATSGADSLPRRVAPIIVERFLDGRRQPEAVTDPLRSGGQA